jgi:hypothetical protein
LDASHFRTFYDSSHEVPMRRATLTTVLLVGSVSLLTVACARGNATIAALPPSPLAAPANSAAGHDSGTTATHRTAAAVPLDTAWYASATGATPVLRQIAGVRTEPGPFRYYYRTPATASLSAHRHTADMHIRVLEGRQYILMGPDLETARVQHFDVGSEFVIPAGTWHVEWFETDTLVEISGVGPMRTERATPATPRLRPNR